MKTLASLRPWLEAFVADGTDEIIYGFANLAGLLPQPFEHLPHAVSFAVRMNDPLMDSVRQGPTAAYFAEYRRVNQYINDTGDGIAAQLREAGYAAERIHSSETVDAVNFTGIFQHKTAAVMAGYGWIGRNCQLVTRAFGPRVRLGTVLTNMPLGEAPVTRMRSYCGSCQRCVDACPVGALTGNAWSEDSSRSDLFDAQTCRAWLHEQYPQYHAICGVCTSACPQGTARRQKRSS